MKNLLIRSCSGFVFVAIIIAAIYFSAVSYASVFFLLMLVGLKEMIKITQKTALRPNIAWVYMVSILIYAYFYLAYSDFYFLDKEWPLSYMRYFPLLIVVCAVFLFVWELFRNAEKPIYNIAVSFFICLYVAVPFALLNYMANPESSAEYYRPELLLSFFLLIWTNDTFAYLSGVLLGKHKLCPRLSPKKSWEGAIGGLVFTLVVAFCIGRYTDILPIGVWMLLALIIVVFGICGDLVESMFKRNVEIKDSGNLMPGHGGVLDRFDAVLLAAPMVSVVLCYVFMK